MSGLDATKYEIVPIGIARDGHWYLRNDAIRLLGSAAPRLAELEQGGTPVSLLPHPDSRGLVPRIEGGMDNQNTNDSFSGALDVIFPVLHGTYGEDGTVQGVFELAGIPYVGAGVLGSALGMDKDAQKRILRDARIPIVRYAALNRLDYDEHPELAQRLGQELGFPLFVKPNALGSSIGTSKVKKPDALKTALDDAFQYDRKVLLEEACEGREFECSVLGNSRPEASLPGEVIVKGNHDFYSYESKYVDPDGAEYKIPAELPPAAVHQIQALSIEAFKVLDLRGMARVDFFARRDLGEIFVNEVNTIPGFTSISMYPKLWEVSGLPLPALLDRLIELALEEHRGRAALKFSYQPRR
jgi:D-alanine-D-alanine ligase